jgi:hypothetical protein
VGHIQHSWCAESVDIKLYVIFWCSLYIIIWRALETRMAKAPRENTTHRSTYHKEREEHFRNTVDRRRHDTFLFNSIPMHARGTE